MRLLLAEDDAILSDALTTQLRNQGFVVEHAPNGPVAEFLLLREDFDAAILDIGLPMTDGLSVLRRVRQSKPALPVLVLTALDGLDDRVAGLNAGADDYLTKPFDFPELDARVRALLRRAGALKAASAGPAGLAAPVGLAAPAAGAVPAAPTMARLVFDREARRASVDGNAIDLSPRECDLLDLLLGHRGRVVRKTQIVEAWAPDRSPSDDGPAAPGMIEVYIHRLRRKLEGSGLSIRTVRGLGYLLELDPADGR